MKFKSLVVLAVVTLTIPVAAQEFSDYARHGNCVTGTASDPMSDESGAFFVCGSEPTVIVIGRLPGQLGLAIAVQTNVTKTVAEKSTLEEIGQISNSEVKFRVDKGEILTGHGYLSQDGLINVENDSLAKQIAQEISDGQKLHFSIDDTGTETIQLEGANEAVEDMRRRLK